MVNSNGTELQITKKKNLRSHGMGIFERRGKQLPAFATVIIICFIIIVVTILLSITTARISFLIFHFFIDIATFVF
ncbi:hypothetical protein L228DRAFT_144499 [Xylona heveae TC161]|uniref:Uncharacterized protein n=1 Tax=Xylona heveae (strain CBS 132557 / TC161) TaxID=1328760 RepID=A0A165GC03_XYLHT|nr:hypothetical protein L228DRAFT_144499 [Xylona heveae TC161]KZF22006.1 hypothetical protein L228DRAFT_144499 [Xylona heveae TC161]